MFDFIYRFIQKKGLEAFQKYYSIYVGVVKDNNDPESRERVRVYVPQLHYDFTGGVWAEARNTLSGDGHGIQNLPEVGDIVNVEFRLGDIRYPIWSHASYALREKPKRFDNVTIKGIVTKSGHHAIIDDANGVLELFHKDGHQISIQGTDDKSGILIKHKSGRTIIVSEKVIQFDDGKNGEFIKIDELIKKLNNMEDMLNDLANKFNTHTHTTTATIGASTVPGVIAPTTTQETTTLTKTSKDDIKNDKILH